MGNSVYAIAAGTVITAQDYQCQGSHYKGKVTCSLGSACPSVADTSSGSYGNFIIIDHGNSVYSYYAHLSTGSFSVSRNQTVQQGQQIALTGNSGNSSGPHLHIEMRIGGRAKDNRVDPQNYLTRINTPTSNVDVGTNFYAYIINTASWNHLTNDQPNVSARTLTGAPNQVWYFERLSDGSYKITSALDGKALDVDGMGTADGTNVKTYEYNGNDAQQWFISGASAEYYFQSKCAITVLDVNGGSHESGTNVQMWTKNESDAQKFQIWKLDGYKPPMDIGSNFTALILNQAAWIPLANSYSEGDKAPVRLETETGSANQLWYFDRQSDGSYKIASCYDGKYLDVRDGSLEQCAVIQTCENTGMDAQKWYIYHESGGYILESKSAKYVMDLANGDASIPDCGTTESIPCEK